MKNDNPILNNPYKPPVYHYATDPKDGSLNYTDIRKGRRIFTREKQVIPLKQVQASLLDMNETSTTEDLNHIINLLRKEIADWRNKGYPDVTRVSQTLLNFWFNNPEREITKNLFFAQQEAIETAIWLNEVADKTNPGNNILSQLKDSWTIIPDAEKILTSQTSLPAELKTFSTAYNSAGDSSSNILLLRLVHDDELPVICHRIRCCYFPDESPRRAKNVFNRIKFSGGLVVKHTIASAST